MPAERFKRNYLSIFLTYYKPHLKLFILDIICALGISAVDLAFPYGSRLALNELLPQNMFGAFFSVMGILLLAYLLRTGMQYVVAYFGHIMGVRMEADMRRDLFAHMQTLSFSFFDKNRTGQLMSCATTDLFEITELSHHGPEDLLISLITLIGALCFMLSIHWKLALIVFAIVPIFAVFTIVLRRKMMTASVEVKRTIAGINGQLESSISGMRTAKAFANEAQENAKFTNSNDTFKGAKRGYYKSMAIYHSGLEFALPVMQVLTIAMGGFFIMRGEMNLVDLITFSLYISTFLAPVRKLSAFVEQYLNGMAGFKRFVDLMRTEPDIQDTPDAVTMDVARGDILIDDVSFHYDEGEEVLDHVSIHIPQGETVAVVGPSGGGKSTLCQLIPRFYDVTGGRILVDGQDVRQVTQHSLRQNIGIVQQDVFLFAGTVIENIRYGKPDATEEEIVAAAKRAEIYEDIMAMPDGFNTYVGERGVMLSGGQKQRISIARIFLKNPPILILDEATSALDSVTEARIQSAFDELAKGRTTLIIAHRLSTIRNAHRIIVVDDNHIVEEGTHEELLEKNGEYAGLYNAQKKVSV